MRSWTPRWPGGSQGGFSITAFRAGRSDHGTAAHHENSTHPGWPLTYSRGQSRTTEHVSTRFLICVQPWISLFYLPCFLASLCHAEEGHVFCTWAPTHLPRWP